MRILKITAGLVAVLAIAVATGATTASAHEEQHLRTYRVTLTNLTHGQPLSPPVAATHEGRGRLFRFGKLASDDIAAIAQDGNEAPLAASLSADDDVTDVVDVGTPLTPSGTTVGPFSDSVTFDISARPGDRLSLATMLICTNDGFTGLVGGRLPTHGSKTYRLYAFDAGREMNTQDSTDIVDPCSALGPAPLAGDPNGNLDGPVENHPAQPIEPHPGITGVGDLSPAMHGWSGAVAMVTVERTS